MTNSITPTPHASSDYAKTSFLLGITKALLVPATQPFQVTMRLQQGALYRNQILSAPNALREIISASPKTYGLPTAIFRGSLSAMIKEAIKNGTYKAVALKGAPKLVSTTLNTPYFQSMSKINQHSTIAFTAAVTASAVDTAFGGPFERFATYRATTQGAQSNANFLHELRSKGSFNNQFKFLYKGSGATFVKTGLACTALFGFSGPIQQQVHNAYNLQPGDDIPISASGLIAFFTGITAALLSSPFDIVKTIHQMPQSTGNESTISILLNNIKRFGMRGATAGVPIKTGMAALGWGAASAFTQQSNQVPNKYYHSFFSDDQISTENTKPRAPVTLDTQTHITEQQASCEDSTTRRLGS